MESARSDLALQIIFTKKGLWKDDFEKVVIKEADEKIQKAVEIASKTPPPKPEEMFDYLFAEPTQTLKDQKEFLLNSLKPNS